MKKLPFVTNEQLKNILEQFPTPFHLYDEKGIRENAKAMYEAFSWNKGFREYFAVKAEPNPFVIGIMQQEGCGFDYVDVSFKIRHTDTFMKGILTREDDF